MEAQPAPPASGPTSLAAGDQRHNLPIALTSFIGRARERGEVTRLLTTTRLLTLTGAGGCGKTRLALAVALAVVPAYPDGVWLVELAALADAALLPQAVAAALVVREEPQRALTATLVDALGSRTLLLVLDNCEHLLDSCVYLAEMLLNACPHLRILATSRETLGVAGETTWLVPSLALPAAQYLPPLEELAQSEAVQLFVERAASALPTFTLTEANATAVAQVCQRLDGIPLAIELAAARVKVLAVEQLAARLDDSLRLLQGGTRTALPRQQTLRATFDWSYALLSEPERTLFRRLAVFAGGWTLEAAEAICACADIAAAGILDLLAHLVDKSLVIVDVPSSGAARYRLLGLVQQYALEQLREANEAEAIQRQHAQFFLTLAEAAEPQLHGAAQVAWLKRLDTEHDNLRAALLWCLECGAAELALRLSGVLVPFWTVHSYLSEGRKWLETVLAQSSGVPTSAYAKALNGVGVLAGFQEDYAAARTRFQESLVISQASADQRNGAYACFGLGHAAYFQGDYAQATILLQESMALFQDLQDTWGVAASLYNLGRVAHRQGNDERASALLEESLSISQAVGDLWLVANVYYSLGRVALDQGNYPGARMHFEHSLRLRRELGDRQGIAYALFGLGRVTLRQGDPVLARTLQEQRLAVERELNNKPGIAESLSDLGDVVLAQGKHQEATALFAESLELRRELGHTAEIAQCLVGLARVAEVQGQSKHAALLCGAAEALLAAIGRELDPIDCIEYTQNVAAVRAQLDEAAFAAAWAAGRALSVEQAIADALAGTDPSAEISARPLIP